MNKLEGLPVELLLLAQAVDLDGESMHAHAYPSMLAQAQNVLKESGYDNPAAALQENPTLMAGAQSFFNYAGADNLGNDKYGQPFRPIKELTNAIKEVEVAQGPYADIYAALDVDPNNPHHGWAYEGMVSQIDAALKNAGYNDPATALQENSTLMAGAQSYLMYAGADNLGYNNDGTPFRPISELTDAIKDLQDDVNARRVYDPVTVFEVNNNQLDGLSSIPLYDHNGDATGLQWNFTDPVIMDIRPVEGNPLLYSIQFDEEGAGKPFVGFVKAADFVKLSQEIEALPSTPNADNNTLVAIENRGRAGGMVVITPDGEEHKLSKFGGKQKLVEKFGFTQEQAEEAYDGYAPRREFTVEGLPEDDASLQQEQTNDYAHLRVRCPCGPLTWDKPLANVAIPAAIDPPSSVLSEPFSDMAAAYKAHLESLRPDSTAAPVTADVQQPSPEPVQMALDTTAPSMGSSFA
ncbi:MAG: hypothetical protein ACRBCT_05305 [Alphaproteobacteria bacterium]